MTVTSTTPLPWVETPALAPEEFALVRRRAIFDCAKWDPQVEDVATLAPFPIVLRRAAWNAVARLAEALAAEASAAEAELLADACAHRMLALPWRIRRALVRSRRFGPARGAARVIRFDFHWTTCGWRISEANSDVPGGFSEASGFAALMARRYPGLVPAGDPVDALADAILRATGPGAVVALAHATAYTDDRQVMVYLARRWSSLGLTCRLTGPDNLRWRDGRASIHAADYAGPADFVFRFFPAEWLPNLPRSSGWRHFFAGGLTPMSNPGSSLITQSKRFPLVWPLLSRPLATWRLLLPETLDPRELPNGIGDDWVFKPAFGRVGEDIGISGVTPPEDYARILADVARRPRLWAAQRRFQTVPFSQDGKTYYPCIGVYTVDGRVAGAYGRLTRSPITDCRAMEAAVLLAPTEL